MLRKYYLITFIILCFSLSAEVPTRYKLNIETGSVLRGSIIDQWIGTRPIMGAEAAVEFLPTGKIESLGWYNNASIGLAAGYLNLTNDALLGQAFTIHTYLNIPFVRLPHFEFGMRPGVGLAFVNKNYYNTVPDSLMYVPGSIQYPISNGTFGSYTNAFFNAALYFSFPIKNGWALTASYGWYHISNGSIKQPNSGFNMFNGQLGVTYQPHAERYHSPAANVPKGLYEGKRWDVEMALTGGLRQAYFADKHFFGVGTISISAHWRPWSIFKIGGGVDAFYDGYYRSVYKNFATQNETTPITYFGKTYLTESRIENCFRVGISLQPEFVLGDLTLGLHAGVYLFDPVKNLEPFTELKDMGGKNAMKPNSRFDRGIFYNYDILNAGVQQDGWLYLHIVLKYRVTKHLFVQAAAKSHMMKVEFFDIGLGVAF